MKKITEQRRELARLVTPWTHDGCIPPNFIRETGMGTEIARVDLRCGGFQDSHYPVIIGWKAQRGSSLQKGVVLVTGEFGNKEAAIEEAKRLADEGLEQLAASEAAMYPNSSS